jgi:hypothetical protein
MAWKRTCCPGGGGASTKLVRAGTTSAYSTRIPPQYTERFGCEELHGAFLQHRADRGGNAASVILPLPEGEAFFDFAMEQARRHKARVGFVCDTADQAVAALERARRALPKHRPVSIERAGAGRWGLS